MEGEKMDEQQFQITLFKHVTSGGAVYLTDNHRFADATLIIRLDGGPELVGCKVEVDA
jgi:hypothetical protein